MVAYSLCSPTNDRQLTRKTVQLNYSSFIIRNSCKDSSAMLTLKCLLFTLCTRSRFINDLLPVKWDVKLYSLSLCNRCDLSADFNTNI